MHVVQSTICKPSTDATRLPSASLSPLFTPYKLKLMACLLLPRMQRRNPRRPWLMPARLADELRAEQDHATSMGTAKNSLGNQLGELEGSLSDGENAAMKGGKAAMAKMEGKIRELEAELASTQSRTGEASKALQRAERK